MCCSLCLWLSGTMHGCSNLIFVQISTFLYIIKWITCVCSPSSEHPLFICCSGEQKGTTEKSHEHVFYLWLLGPMCTGLQLHMRLNVVLWLLDACGICAFFYYNHITIIAVKGIHFLPWLIAEETGINKYCKINWLNKHNVVLLFCCIPGGKCIPETSWHFDPAFVACLYAYWFLAALKWICEDFKEMLKQATFIRKQAAKPCQLPLCTQTSYIYLVDKVWLSN